MGDYKNTIKGIANMRVISVGVYACIITPHVHCKNGV